MTTRTQKNTDFDLTVEGVGRFTFGRRTMGDELAIQREYSNIIQGVEPSAWLATMAGWLSVFRVLTVRAPEGWNPDEMDPLDESTYANLFKVYTALREKEGSFRPGSKVAPQANGA